MTHIGSRSITAISRPTLACVALLLALTTLVIPQDACALRSNERPPWLLGVGMGYGRGSFEGPSLSSASYRNGAAPQIQLGHMLGQHAMVGVIYEGWMVEIGRTVGVADTVAIKFRRSLQNLSLGFTLFPGNPHNAWGGVFLRAAAGTGWAGTAVNEVFASEAQHNAPRLDEWGVGVSTSLGYEFRIGHNFATGVSATFNWYDIDERVVERGRFGALLMNLTLYF